MGYYHSKPQQNNVALAQSVSNENIGEKVNFMGIVLIVIAVVFGVLIIFMLKSQFKKRMRSWFRKEASAAICTTPPVVKVHTVPVVQTTTSSPQGTQNAYSM